MRASIVASLLLPLLLGAPTVNPPRVTTAPALRHPAIQMEPGERFAFRLSETVDFRGVTDFRGTEPRSWSGRLDDGAGTFTVIEHARRHFAVIQLADRTYEIVARGARDPLTVRTIDHRALPRFCGTGRSSGSPISAALPTCALAGQPCSEATGAMTFAGSSSDPCVQVEPANDPPPLITVAVAYTPAVENASGAFAIAIRTLIAIAQTNAAFHLSGIPARAKLAKRGCIFRPQPCVREVEYDESDKAISWDLKQVQCRSSNCLLAVRELRDNCDADLAILLVNDSCNIGDVEVHGRACVMTTLTPAYADYALAVVHAESAVATMTFTHELGHMLGAGHENSAGLCGDSRGYEFAAANSTRTTIMHSDAMSRTPYFSNPAVLYQGNGSPVGVQDQNDNARTIRISAGTVSQFR